MENTFNITIDKNDILDEIYANSAWHVIAYPTAKCLTPDLEPLLLKRMEAGFHDFEARFLGYISDALFLPRLEKGNISLSMHLQNEPTELLQTEVKQALTLLLANFVLNDLYHHQCNTFEIGWKRYRAQLSVILARDSNHC